MTHVGDGKLQTPSHCFRLDNILRVLDLASNILSVHKLCLQNNAFCYFDANQFLIVDLATGKVLYQGLSKDGVYPIPFSSQLSANSAIASSLDFKSSVNVLVSNEAMLWHQRLGHLCSKLLHSTLSSFNNNVKISVHDDICSQCKSCISAKMHKLPFPQHIMSSTSPLKLVHSDVWGPTPVTFVLSYKYYVIFVDDFTRFTWLFLLKHKSEVFTVFLHFKALVENQFRSKLKTLRIDGGGEYTSNHFKSFCLDHGIQHQLSCPYTPQQNGVVERKHKHIVESGLSMLHQSNLPSFYWCYAFNTAIYLINRLPFSVLAFKSPWEFLFHSVPSLNSLKTFDCACFPLLKPYTDHKL